MDEEIGQIRELLRHALQACVDLYAARASELTPVFTPPASELRRVSPDTAIYQPPDFYWPFAAGEELRADTRTLPQVILLREHLESNPVAGPRLGALVGAGGSASRLEFDEVFFYQALRRHLGRYGLSQVSDESLNDITELLVDSLFAETLVSVTYIPIEGVTCDEESVDLEDGTQLRVMSEDELLFAVQLHALNVHVSSAGVVDLPPNSRLALVHEQELQIVSGQEAHEATAPAVALFAQADALSAAISIATGGSLSPSFQLTKMKPRGYISPQGGGATGVRFNSPSNPYNAAFLDVSKIEEVRKLYRALLQPLPAWLKVAVGRFTSSCDRRETIDSLIDLAVVLEVFFGDEGQNTEIGLRISLRVGLYTRAHPELGRDPGYTRNFVKKIYDARSSAVHTGDVRPNKLPRTIDDESMLLADAVLALRSFLHEVLSTAITGPNGPKRPEWDSLLEELLRTPPSDDGASDPSPG